MGRHTEDLAPYKNGKILLEIAYELFGKDNLKSNKAGTRHKMLCPFHKEKTPSFTILSQGARVPTHGHFKCLGCNASGDVFTLLQRVKRWEFWDAFAYLRKRYYPKIYGSLCNTHRPGRGYQLRLF